MSELKVSVFGMGYVGCVTACCMAEAGHRVIGVELVPEKVETLRSGAVPFVEPGLSELASAQVAQGRLTATTDTREGVLGSDISLVCVGTPSLPTGQLDLSAVEAVCQQIGDALRQKRTRHVVVIRCTVLPGTAERCAEIIARASGKTSPDDFAVLSNPEFLREGSALRDFKNPPFTVIGAEGPEDAQQVSRLYERVDAPLVLTDLATAQMVKYACNLFHATKVVFANELGRISRALGVDSHRVMEIFCLDNKLNLSASYLKPGFAYGGSCLPKDLKAILAVCRENHVAVPMLEGVPDSNRQQIELGIQMVLETGKETIGVLGFSFKPNTDDLRESPHVALVEALIGKGKSVRVYDHNIQLSRLMGANRRFIDQAIPHVVELLADDIDEILESCDCIVIANNDPEYASVLERLEPRHIVVDLVRIARDRATDRGYQGLSW